MDNLVDLGKVAMTLGGVWNDTTNYERLSYVLFENDGCGYIALVSNVGVTPGTNESVWQKAVSAGKSIYQLCVDHGTFVGTEEEFVAAYNAAVRAAEEAAAAAAQTEREVAAAEALRVTAENGRVSAEQGRVTAEGQRVQKENARQLAETAREDSFAISKAACDGATESATAAASNANSKATAANNAATLANQKAELANQKAALAAEKAALADQKATLANDAAALCTELNQHPIRINTTSLHWEIWDSVNDQYVDTGIAAMPNDKGAYDATATYSKLDMVHTSDSTYVSKADNNVGNDVTDTDYWICYADGKQATAAAAVASAAAAACAAYDTRIANLEALTEQLAAEDLSFRDVNNNINHLRNTANCYVVKSTGAFKLPLVYGNAIKNGEVNSAAYTNGGGENQAAFVNHLGNAITSPYIEEHAGCQAVSAVVLWQEVSGMIQNPRLVLGEGEGVRDLLFDVKSCPATGANAVVGILDANGDVIWSWHIWVYPDRLGVTEFTNHTEQTYELLDVALGTSYDDAQKTRFKNVHYQWGRKDPMLSPAAYNSNSNHAQYGDKQFAVNSGPAANIAAAIKAPNKFFTIDSENNNDWQSAVAKRFNHWDAACTAAGASDNEVVKTVYDPSPVGFKVPNGRVFTGFTTTGSNSSDSSQFNVVGSFAAGWKFKANAEDTDGQFFPASGYRYDSSGALLYVSSGGYYWSSAAYSATYAYYLFFYSGGVSPLDGNYRAGGFSVRPVRE